MLFIRGGLISKSTQITVSVGARMMGKKQQSSIYIQIEAVTYSLY